MNPIDKVAHCSKLGVFTSKMMLEKINCNSILFIGEDIMNIIHEYVHWNTTTKNCGPVENLLYTSNSRYKWSMMNVLQLSLK